MVKFTSALLVLVAASQARATTYCDTWDVIPAGVYTVYNNLWGASAATSGSQCIEVTSINGDVIAWETTWTWEGGPYNVKSYSNVAVTQGIPVQLSAISSIPTMWSWSLTGNNLVCDVSYDSFLSSSSGGSNEFEVMIWLDNVNAGPLGSQIGTYSYDGVNWSLSKGSNGVQTVYSFVAPSAVNNFNTDIFPFYQHLVSIGAFSDSYYLTDLQSGTEPFTGSSAVLITSAFSGQIKTGGNPPTTTTAHTTTHAATTTAHTTTTTKATSGNCAAHWGQCAGEGWTGATCCQSPYTCQYSNPWYSQCL